MLLIGDKLKTKTTNNQLSSLPVPFCGHTGKQLEGGGPGNQNTRLLGEKAKGVDRGLWGLQDSQTPRLPEFLPPKPSHINPEPPGKRGRSISDTPQPRLFPHPPSFLSL